MLKSAGTLKFRLSETVKYLAQSSSNSCDVTYSSVKTKSKITPNFCGLPRIYWLYQDYRLYRKTTYRKVASSRLSWLVAHPSTFRMFIKGKFDTYALWSLTRSFQNWTVDQSTARDFTVHCLLSSVLSVATVYGYILYYILVARHISRVFMT